jgi:hypothetical protein
MKRLGVKALETHEDPIENKMQLKVTKVLTAMCTAVSLEF